MGPTHRHEGRFVTKIGTRDRGIIACVAGVFLGQVNFQKLMIVYSTGLLWSRVRVNGAGRGREEVRRMFIVPPLPAPPF